MVADLPIVDLNPRDDDALAREHTRVGAAMFPGSRQVQSMQWTEAVNTLNGALPRGSFGGPMGSFFYKTVRHADFDPEWPINPDWPAVVRGLRGSTHLSQADFAQVCGLGRATIERWESGRAVPFHGDALQLLSLIRPYLSNPVQAGQLLNVAAASVLPRITRPTARYTGWDLASMLRSERHDHSDLGHGLIHALLRAQILVAIDPDGDELEDTYVLLAGHARAFVDQPPWLIELSSALRRLSVSDRQLVVNLAKRLPVQRSGDNSVAPAGDHVLRSNN